MRRGRSSCAQRRLAHRTRVATRGGRSIRAYRPSRSCWWRRQSEARRVNERRAGEGFLGPPHAPRQQCPVFEADAEKESSIARKAHACNGPRMGTRRNAGTVFVEARVSENGHPSVLKQRSMAHRSSQGQVAQLDFCTNNEGSSKSTTQHSAAVKKRYAMIIYLIQHEPSTRIFTSYPAARRSPLGDRWAHVSSHEASSRLAFGQAPCTGHPRRLVHVAHLTFLSCEGREKLAPSPAPK